MIIIFMFSNANSTKSLNTSDKVISDIVDITDSNIDNKDKEIIIKNNTYVIRKLAHITEYIILGILMINCLKDYNINKLILTSILLCILYSISDEIHQLFIDGRSGSIIDVLIDSIGILIGTFLYVIINRKHEVVYIN